MSNTLNDILINARITDFSSAEKFVKEQLKSLQGSGDLTLGHDKDLMGVSLELRVKQLFKEAGFNISDGEIGKEDFIVFSKENDDIKDNLVIEVKSSRKPQPSLDNLRQLDDWVYYLSGEEQARKHGLGGGLDPLAMAYRGICTSNRRHPTPHKGVFIFNGPVGVPFSERSNILHQNHNEFVEKRNFCIIGINDLAELLRKDYQAVWAKLHGTVGEYHLQ